MIMSKRLFSLYASNLDAYSLFHVRKVRLGGDELFVADVHVEDDSGSAGFCGFQNPVFFCGIVCVEADEHVHYV